MQILNGNLIGPRNAYLCGDRITIADYLGAPMLTLGEVIRCDFSGYPNINRWLGNMKGLKSWNKVNEPFYGLLGAFKEMGFEAI